MTTPRQPDWRCGKWVGGAIVLGGCGAERHRVALGAGLAQRVPPVRTDTKELVLMAMAGATGRLLAPGWTRAQLRISPGRCLPVTRADTAAGSPPTRGRASRTGRFKHEVNFLEG
jgi:hypothetical protein